MRTCIAILCLATAPMGLVAQASDSSCVALEARVRQDVAHGRPHALEDLVHCPVPGARVLAELWRDRNTSPEVFAVMRSVSQGIRGPDLFAAVEANARDAGAPPQRRLAALQVLVKYIDPREDLPTPKLSTIQPGSTLWLCVDCGRASADSSYDPALRPRALAVFDALTRDPSPDVKRVATSVLQAFAAAVPGEIPLDPGALSGSVDCATRVLTLTNRSAIALPLTLRRANTEGATRLSAKGTWGGQDGVTHLTLGSAEPVELFLGERQLLRLECTSAH